MKQTACGRRGPAGAGRLATALATFLLATAVPVEAGPPTPPAAAGPAAAVAPGPAAAAATTEPATVAAPVLGIEDLRPGIGQVAQQGMVVAVHYTGWLYDPAAADFRGRKFDSSRDRPRPFVFPLGAGRVIRGWDEGVPGMQVGGLRRLVIPPEYGYGSRNIGNGLIPPNSTLLFEVELLGIESLTTTPQSK